MPAAAVRLLPTPTVSDANGTGGARGGGPNLATVSTTTHGLGQTDWGCYRPAIDRWAIVLGRQAPAPTQPGTTGTPVLAPALVEWLMGLPEGWVTDPGLGLRRTVQLRLLGNGVVPQQAALALRILLCPHLWASP